MRMKLRCISFSHSLHFYFIVDYQSRPSLSPYPFLSPSIFPSRPLSFLHPFLSHYNPPSLPLTLPPSLPPFFSLPEKASPSPHNPVRPPPSSNTLPPSTASRSQPLSSEKRRMDSELHTRILPWSGTRYVNANVV